MLRSNLERLTERSVQSKGQFASLTVRFDAALQEAAQVDKLIEEETGGEEVLEDRLPLLGVPLSVKESFALQGKLSSSAPEAPAAVGPNSQREFLKQRVHIVCSDLCCWVVFQRSLPRFPNMPPPPLRRNAPHLGSEVPERRHFHCRLSSGGPAEEGWGHTAGGDKHQRGVHVAGVQQPHARHHQQPVQHREDCGWQLRWAVSGDRARPCWIIALHRLLRFFEQKWLLSFHFLLAADDGTGLCHCRCKECKSLWKQKKGATQFNHVTSTAQQRDPIKSSTIFLL